MLHKLRPSTIIAVLIVGLTIAAIRFFHATYEWSIGNNTEIEAYSFTVLFPLFLIVILVLFKRTKTKEGLLMRFGAILHLLLILGLENLSLYLALGFPVVFLVVEIFTTRLPGKLTQPIERVFIE